jgi:nitronate monooxygenase
VEPNRLTAALGLRHPIVQGPFGGGLSTVALAAAVADLGGLGSFGAHHLSGDELLAVGRSLRAATAGVFALNLWVGGHDPGGDWLSEDDYQRGLRLFEPYARELGVTLAPRPTRCGVELAEQLEALLQVAPPVWSFVFGVPPPDVLAACRRRGILTIGAATSLDEARALDDAGVDAIVATGAEAGGHRPSFLTPAEDALMGTMALVPQVVDRVRAPVIAAGGIADARGRAAAHALGASAIQVGTGFLACEESGASPLHRALLWSERARTTTLTRAFSGRLARGMTNRLTRELAARAAEILPYPAQGWFTAQLRPAALAAENPELLSLWCGQIAPNLRHRTAAALFAALLAPPTTKEPTP